MIFFTYILLNWNVILINMSVYVCIYNQSYRNKYENNKSQLCFLFDSLHEQKIKVISVCGAFLTNVAISLILDTEVLMRSLYRFYSKRRQTRHGTLITQCDSWLDNQL